MDITSKKWTYVQWRSAKYNDCASCGVYVCAHAYALARAEDYKSSNQNLFEFLPRDHTAASLVLRKFMLARIFEHGIALLAPAKKQQSTQHESLGFGRGHEYKGMAKDEHE